MKKLIRYHLCAALLFAITAQSAYGAATALRKLADDEIAIEGKAVKIRCDAQEESGLDETFGEKILQERDDAYETLRLLTAELVRKQADEQRVPLDEIENENQALADMSDTHQEQIEALQDELDGISADIAEAEQALVREAGFVSKVKAYHAVMRLTARKKELNKKINDLHSVRAELEEGIGKNNENASDLRTAIATAFKTQEMGELESKIAMSAAYHAKALAFCKSKSKFQKPFAMPQIEGGAPLGPFGPCIKGGCAPRPADGPIPAIPQPKQPVRRCLPAAGGRAVCFDEYGIPDTVPQLPS